MNRQHEGNSQVLAQAVAWIIGVALVVGYVHSVARLAGLAA